MFYDKSSRRQFLIGMNRFALALPFMPSLIPRAYAAGVLPKRFISVFHGNGTEADKFWPRSIPMANFNGGQRGTLTSSNAIISQILGSPFNSLKEKMTIIHGLNRDRMGRDSSGHNPMICLAGAHEMRIFDSKGNRIKKNGKFVRTKDGKYTGEYSAWPSLDQVLANSGQVYPQSPQQRSIHLLRHRQGLRFVKERRDTISFKVVAGKFVDIYPERNPGLMFDKLFGANTQGTTSENPYSYKKVVDKIFEKYKSLKSNRRISSADKFALEVHMEHLNELEKNLLQLPGGVQCTTSQRPGDHAVDPKSRKEVDRYMSAHIDLIVAAIRCNMTNVATLMLNSSTDAEEFKFLPGYDNNSFHRESHYGQGGSNDPASRRNHLVEIHKWLLSKLAELATKLDISEGGNETFLDNSLIVLTNTQGTGSHSGSNIPTVILGSGGGAIRNNQYLKLSGKPAYNQLLVSIAQAMGLSPSDYRQGGRPGFGTYYHSSIASDTPLPGLMK